MSRHDPRRGMGPTRGRRSLAERVVIVTGSSRGIGRETARLLLDVGATVVLNGRNPARLEETRAELVRGSGPGGPAERISSVACDVSTETGAAALINHAVEHWGRIDGLVNNAGISMRGPARDLTQETLDALVAGNLRSAVLPTVAALRHLEQQAGAIVFVTTVAAIHGFPGVSAYSATKAAVEVFAQSLDAEERSRGVRVATVFLGFVENDPDKTTLAADGRAFHHERRAMQSQRDAAEEILAALRGGRRRRITVFPGRLLDLAQRISPRLVGAVLARSGGRIHRVDR